MTSNFSLCAFCNQPFKKARMQEHVLEAHADSPLLRMRLALKNLTACAEAAMANVNNVNTDADTLLHDLRTATRAARDLLRETN